MQLDHQGYEQDISAGDHILSILNMQKFSFRLNGAGSFTLSGRIGTTWFEIMSTTAMSADEYHLSGLPWAELKITASTSGKLFVKALGENR